MSARIQSVTMGKLFNLSLHWGPCIFRWGAGYLHQSCCGPWAYNRTHSISQVSRTQHIPRVLCFFLFSSPPSRFNACSSRGPESSKPARHVPREQAFFWSGTLTNPGQHGHLHYKILLSFRRKENILLSPLHPILYTLLFHRGGNINFSYSIFSKYLNSFHFSSKWVLASGNNNTLTLCVSSQVLLYTFSFNKISKI